MILNRVRVKNFKKVKDIELELSNINILVGVNGCGKSSVLQALHLGYCLVRQSSDFNDYKTATVDLDKLDYLPSDDYRALGHNSHLGNKKSSSSSNLLFYFADGHDTLEASCQMRSAVNNAGFSINGNIPHALLSLFGKKKDFFSVYVPAIAGIPSKEERKGNKTIVRSCFDATSNTLLRNILLTLKERNASNINKVMEWTNYVTGNNIDDIWVWHDYDNDVFIGCYVRIQGHSIPIELLGSGFLQLIRIFAQILLFNPVLLMLDEVDIHLHPNTQERLVKLLDNIAEERGLRVILSSHSPFIIRGAPSNANVFWLENGKLNSQNRSQVELALGWGAFGKKILIISEDNDTKFIKKIISQWPEIEKFVAFVPGSGYKHIPSPSEARSLSETFGSMYKIFIHRDRDSLTDSEMQTLKDKYEIEGICLWFPCVSDIEAYFCDVDFISDFLKISIDDARVLLDEVLAQQQQQFKDQFNKQRVAHNGELYKEGGSPLSNDIWNELQSTFLKGAKGKAVYNKLKDKVPKGKFSDVAILGHKLEVEIAYELKIVLQQLLNNL